MKTNATPQNFQAYFFGAAQRRFSLLPPIRCAGFLMGKRHRVTRMFTTCSFSFILSGRGTYLHRGRTLRVVAPCLLLEWPGEAMDYGPDDSWDETFISYPADLIGTFCRSGFMDLDEPVRPIPDPRRPRAGELVCIGSSAIAHDPIAPTHLHSCSPPHFSLGQRGKGRPHHTARTAAC